MYNLFNKFLSDSSALLLHTCVQLRQPYKLVETTQIFLQCMPSTMLRFAGKGRKSLLGLKSTVNTLRAQLSLTPVSIAITVLSQEPPSLQLETAATSSCPMGGGDAGPVGGGPVGGDMGPVGGGDTGLVDGGDAGPVDGDDTGPVDGSDTEPMDGGDVHPVNTGAAAGDDIVGGRFTPRPKAKRSLSYGTPQSTKKALPLKVLYIKSQEVLDLVVVCT